MDWVSMRSFSCGNARIIGNQLVVISTKTESTGSRMLKKAVNLTYKTARRIAVLVVGSTVVLIGIVMLVTPGPGLIVIPIGLAILGIEFTWARIWLRKVRESISNHNSKNHAARAEHHRDRAQR
jgi:tellurite resistance protein TerC